MSEYSLPPLSAPRSAGNTLKVLAWLAEGRLLGPALAAKFLADVGVEALRLAPCTHALPSIHPLLVGSPASGKPREVDLPLESTLALPLETAGDFTAAYRTGDLTPMQVAERVVAWSTESNALAPPLRAVIAQRVDAVMQQAREATGRWKEGVPLGPLDGVPVGVKDELDVAGYKTQAGTTFLGTTAATADATAVARLRAAGAVIIGKLNMHEIGLGVTGVNPHHGAARNPYDPTRATGGSSSGSAAAVAAGLCPIALGADGGGSIRIPAALCGVFGLKATFGRISEHGAAPLCWSVGHVGPLAASARDLALAYGIIAGPDHADPRTLSQPPVEMDGWEREVAGLRVGIFRPWFEDAEPGVVAACDAAVAGLVERGAQVVDIVVPDLHLLRTAHMVTIVSEMVAGLRTHYIQHRTDYGYDTRLNLALAGRLLGADYVQAQRVRARFDALFADIMTRVDVVATPTTGRTAPVIPADALVTGDSNLALTDQIMRFAVAGNMTGLPAISVPVGYDAEGLPVGLQLMGRAHAESTLLGLGRVIETWVERRAPVVHRGLLGR